VGKIGGIVKGAYMAVILVGLVWYTLDVKNGYRVWWLVWFYAVLVIASIAGIVSHHRTVRRNGTS
jgi:hypothetical protein